MPERAIRHWLPPSLDNPKTRLRIQKYLANGLYSPKEKGSFAERVFRDGLEAIDLAGANKPFALVVDTFEPHEPWTPPRKYIDMYGDPDYRGPEPGMIRYNAVTNYLSDAEADVLVPRMKALYAAEVTMTDYWLGVFLDRLADRKLDRDTMFVLVSDHGVFLGEHNFTGKSSEMLHPELIHVPMIVVDPKRRRSGDTSTYFASTHDVGPTVLSMAGVEAPERMDGVDLSSLFAGNQPSAEALRVRGLQEQLLPAHRPLGDVGDQRARQVPAVRPEGGSGRDAQPGGSQPAQGAAAVRGREAQRRRQAPYYEDLKTKK